MNILALNNGTSGTDFYRTQVPLGELARHGHQVRIPPPEMTATRVGELATAQDAGMPTDDALYWADIIMGRQLCYPGLPPHWDRWHAFGPLVYETDDDVFHVDTSNPALIAFMHPGVEAALKRMLAAADLITVTTDYLAEQMSRWNPNVAVLPNCVPARLLDMPKPAPPDGRVTVGWTPSSSHIRDLLAHARPIREFFLAHPDVGFHLIGVDYRPMLELPGVRLTDWAPVWDYYAAVDFDIGIAPLERNPFNWSKSPIKALEYAARGIPTVAPAGLAYDGFVRHGETGFLVRDPDDWGRYLGALCSDTAMREEMGAKAKAVAAEFTIERRWPAWEAAYRSVL